MATFTHSRYTDTTAPRSQVGENVEVIDYLIPAGFATADIVNLLRLPAGATLLDATLITDAGVGSTGNLKLGTDLDDDALIPQQNITAAATHRASTIAGMGLKLAAATDIRLTAGTIATPTVGTKVRVILRYAFNLL